MVAERSTEIALAQAIAYRKASAQELVVGCELIGDTRSVAAGDVPRVIREATS